MVGRIAPYQANNVQRSYLRQQRVGDRIADARAKESTATPSVDVDISAAARKAAEAANATAAQHKAQQVDTLSERFVEQFLPPAKAEGEDEGADSDKKSEDAAKGRASFVRLIESFGLGVQQNEEGKDEAIVNRQTGEVLVPLTGESRESARDGLRNLVRNILSEVL
ncbi:MAG: hypothetical protein V3V56_05995 [bacterium]